MKKLINVLYILFFFSLFLVQSACSEVVTQLDYFDIKIPFIIGEEVIAIYKNEQYSIGKVHALPTTTRYPSYTASAWGTPGHVCATAVNAIHMLVSIENGRGRTLSIIPRETIAPAAGAGASIIVTSKAGYGPFGSWAPKVGTQVLIQKKGSTSEKILSLNTIPQEGDILILRTKNVPLPYMAEIENHPGGRVFLWDKDGYTVVAKVIKPVGGVGRFEGTLFQRICALRANHSGVIDVSTSNYGDIGGFQIIPWEHAISSKEMQSVWDLTQWLVIGHKDGKSKLGGTYPLFKLGFTTGPSSDERLWDIWSTYGRKSLILFRFNGGKWQKTSSITGRNDKALKNVTHIRLYFPFQEEIQKTR
ncbi:MAG: hypothetical protein ACOXZX_00115 [Synergistaceae bacterium]